MQTQVPMPATASAACATWSFATLVSCLCLNAGAAHLINSLLPAAIKNRLAYVEENTEWTLGDNPRYQFPRDRRNSCDCNCRVSPRLRCCGTSPLLVVGRFELVPLVEVTISNSASMPPFTPAPPPTFLPDATPAPPRCRPS